MNLERLSLALQALVIRIEMILGCENRELFHFIPFCKAIGCLMYVMVTTKSNIAFVVSRVAKFASIPHESHWTTIKRIFCYLAGTPTMGISFIGYVTDFSLKVTMMPIMLGIMTTGSLKHAIYSFFANDVIAWCSKRETCIADSATEVEFAALAESIKEALWLP